MPALLVHDGAEVRLPYGTTRDRWAGPPFAMCIILNGAQHVHLALLTLMRRFTTDMRPLDLP